MARHTCCPSWSHDGRTLAIPAGLPGDRLTTATVDADGRSYKRLPIKDPTLSVACAGGAWSPDDAPRWSPDGRNVVFAANSATASNIYVANADGTGLVQVTHDGHSDSPSWGTRPLSS